MNTTPTHTTLHESRVKEGLKTQHRAVFLVMRFLLIFGIALSLAALPGIAISSSGDLEAQGNSPTGPANLAGEFFYERTFGQTGVPYFADAAHIYNPEGVGVDGAGNLWVAEPLGGRLLKYSGSGSFLMSIGEAGKAWLADNSHISVPMDVTIAGDGTVWAVDQRAPRGQVRRQRHLLMQLGVTWKRVG
jgi:hypothetical protein